MSLYKTPVNSQIPVTNTFSLFLSLDLFTMADTAISSAPIFADLVPTKKGRSRKALKPKDPSSNDANILAGEVSQSSPTIIPSPPEESAGKENHESLSQPQSLKKKKKTTKGASKTKSQQPNQSFEKEFEEMQAKLQQLTLAKEQTDELLKEKEETLKLREEELETRGREQEKLQMELKKLQKLKEFKPTMVCSSLSFSMFFLEFTYPFCLVNEKCRK